MLKKMGKEDIRDGENSMLLYQGRSRTPEALLREGWSSQVHLHICILFKTGKETAVWGA